MRRSRLAAVFAALSVILLIASVLLAAALGDRLDTVFGGVLKPFIACELVAKVGNVKLYSRDIAVLRLVKSLQAQQDGDSLSDEWLLEELIELTLLLKYANDSGITYDAETLDNVLSELYSALDTDEGRRLEEKYKEEFARSDKAFEADLRAAAERELKIDVLLMTLYYAAAAQGMLSDELTEVEAKETLKGRLLPKLRAKTIIEIYR